MGDVVIYKTKLYSGPMLIPAVRKPWQPDPEVPVVGAPGQHTVHHLDMQLDCADKSSFGHEDACRSSYYHRMGQ